MKIFISWSGDLSQKVAIALRDWIPSVIQNVTPYVSSEDIDKGTRWSSDIAGELSDSHYGILCLTTENLTAPWINFEAGALSKAVDTSRVSPFLFGVKRSEVSGPLIQFQSTLAEKEDVKKLLHSINSALPDPLLDSGRLISIFEVWWPHLEKTLTELSLAAAKPVVVSTPPPEKAKTDILEEMLNLLRRQSVTINDPVKLLPPEYVRSIVEERRPLRRHTFDHPAVIELTSKIREFRNRVAHQDEPSRSELLEFLEDLRGPLEYILRHSSSGNRASAFD